MVGKKGYHVVKIGNSWSVKKSGSVLSIHKTQKTATKSAVVRAKRGKTEVVIHEKDGRIRSKDSYGNDPNPPHDTEN